MVDISYIHSNTPTKCTKSYLQFPKQLFPGTINVVYLTTLTPDNPEISVKDKPQVPQAKQPQQPIPITSTVGVVMV